MVPRLIHCCWFGGEKTSLARKCRASWTRFAADFEVREWSMANLGDLGPVPDFVRTALVRKKWAFAADWARFAALARFGGVYLDSDIELVKSPAELLADGEWASGHWRVDGSVGLEASALFLEKGSAIARMMRAHYAAAPFDERETVGEILERKLRDEGLALRVLPPAVLSPIDVRGVCRRTSETVGVHHYAMSWAGPWRRFARFLSWHGARPLVTAGLRVKGVLR